MTEEYEKLERELVVLQQARHRAFLAQARIEDAANELGVAARLAGMKTDLGARLDALRFEVGDLHRVIEEQTNAAQRERRTLGRLAGIAGFHGAPA